MTTETRCPDCGDPIDRLSDDIVAVPIRGQVVEFHAEHVPVKPPEEPRTVGERMAEILDRDMVTSTAAPRIGGSTLLTARPDAAPPDAHRRMVAIHEAGHACVSIRLGIPVPLVSIRPGKSYAGITVIGTDMEFVSRFDPSIEAVRQPRDIRAAIESEIVISLAGPVAGQLVQWSSGYAEPDPCETTAEVAAERLAELSPRHRELVVAMEAEPTPGSTDEDKAYGVSHALTGTHDEAAAHVAWLRLVSTRLVVTGWHRIEAIAAALLERHVLSGDDAAAIYTAARKESDA